jgi:hypothetical protein
MSNPEPPPPNAAGPERIAAFTIISFGVVVVRPPFTNSGKDRGPRRIRDLELKSFVAELV